MPTNPPAGIVVGWMNAAGTGKLHAHHTCGTSTRFLTSPVVVDFTAAGSPAHCQRCEHRGFDPATEENIAEACRFHLVKLDRCHGQAHHESNAGYIARELAGLYRTADELVAARRPARPTTEETTVPETTKPNAAERARAAYSIRPDLNDRGAIARARLACAREVTTNRDLIAGLAYSVSLAEEGPAIRRLSSLKDAVHRLELLLSRIDQLDAMAKALADA